jgi:hypothetical protein
MYQYTLLIFTLGMIYVRSIVPINKIFRGKVRCNEDKISEGFLKLRAGLPEVVTTCNIYTYIFMCISRYI